MTLKKLDILNFKNIAEASLDFCGGVNCLLGSNGMGKSNLLEAIHFVCMARPMTSVTESGLILHGQELMSVNATFAGNDPSSSASDEKVTIGIVRGKGKTLKRNGKEYDRISQHIGAFPVVTVTPADTELVAGGAQERRRMMDMVISQSDPAYLSNLIRYNRSLENRNRMLKGGVTDPILFESVESVMTEAAEAVSKARREWAETIAPAVAANYRAISGASETVELEYSSSLLSSPMTEIIERNRGRDALLGYTTAGIHRDDVEMKLEGHSLRHFGSQGQVKTFTVALRLAIYDTLREKGGPTPLLLLDDIFDKLDSTRVRHIMELVSRSETFGQIFITDTNREHLDETLAALSAPSRLFIVENGKFTA